MIHEYIQNYPARWEADYFRGNNNELREPRTEYNPVPLIHELPNDIFETLSIVGAIHELPLRVCKNDEYQ